MKGGKGREGILPPASYSFEKEKKRRLDLRSGILFTRLVSGKDLANAS